MPAPHEKPRVVFLCHEEDRLDVQGLSRWLANSLELAGLVVIRRSVARRARAARREYRRSGLAGLLDAVAFRVWYALTAWRQDAAWTARTVAKLTADYPADLSAVPRLSVANPNGEAVRAFLRASGADLMLARCKVLLRREVFDAPRLGTFVLHPGICPEYRNAHGCFWALVRRDLGRVGVTLLRIDEGVDTGPIYLHASCAFDEQRESHARIQARVIVENLDAIARTLHEVWRGDAEPLQVHGRPSAVWGQPRLSAYWKWKRAAARRIPVEA